VAGEEIEVMVDVDVVDDDLECAPRRRSSKETTLPGRDVTAVRGSSPCPTARYIGGGELPSVDDGELERFGFSTQPRLFAAWTNTSSSPFSCFSS